MYPKCIQNLINCYKKLPGVGEKTAERMSLQTLNLDQELIEIFSSSLLEIKNNIKRCKYCNNITDQEICSICGDETRNKKLICVVEEPKNVFQLEKIGFYNGLYHVLDGLISPLDDVNPEDINIEELIKKVSNNEIEEIILAVKPSVEGETTALYISKILEKNNVIISKIAHGIPIGADIDYIDSLTLEMALLNRKEIQE